ncbi:hypothetical protein [Leucobacter weissii]|nr:hypothetical protein [Leucobacter weissii]
MIAGLLAASFAVLLGACFSPPVSTPQPGQSQEPAVSQEELFSRIASSDPRVAETLVASVYTSGFADVYAVEVAIFGPDPVTSATLARVLTAALEHAPKESTDKLLFRAHSADDADAILDIATAAEGLPPTAADTQFLDSTGMLSLGAPDLESLRRASQ